MAPTLAQQRTRQERPTGHIKASAVDVQHIVVQRALLAASTAAEAAPGALDPLLAILEPVTVDLQLAQDIRRCLSAE